MELEVSYDFENEQQFWDELYDTVSREYASHTLIDDALRSYLTLVTKYKEYVHTDYDFARCSFQLHSSSVFDQNPDYIRRQLVHCLLQDENSAALQVAAAFLLADARETETTYELLNNEGIFPRLVDLMSRRLKDDETGLHRLLMELLYEMSRVQKIKTDELMQISDDFITELFRIIEELASDVTDPYHYPIIRLLLVLNEQFLLAAHEPGASSTTSSVVLTNKVMKVLSAHGSKYKTFGENIILLLNREDETSLQLLTLKLLFLVFTTPPTYEYFYTNDLRVLVDILIRNLLDLPEESSALRHTYLRVLYPLLSHTQLRLPPQYKRDEIRKLLSILDRGQSSESESDKAIERDWGHFGELDETTKRLVRRCQGVSWLIDPDDEEILQTESPTDDRSTLSSPVSPVKSRPPALPAPRKLTKRNSSKGSALTIGGFLTPQLESARHSSISMAEMAHQREKPGVITPSRNPSLKYNLRTAILLGKKEKPPLPKARRSVASRGDHLREEVDGQSSKPSQPDMETAEEQINDSAEATASVSVTKKEQSSPKSPEIRQAPPIPPRLLHDHKRNPPQLPRARRWRFLSRDEQSGSSDREPGKFNAILPSLRKSGTDHPSAEMSPFSPVEKSLASPKSLATGKNPEPESVSAALQAAQTEANTGIAEAMDTMRVEDEAEAAQDEEVSPTTAVFPSTPAPPPPALESRPVITTRHTRSFSTPIPSSHTQLTQSPTSPQVQNQPPPQVTISTPTTQPAQETQPPSPPSPTMHKPTDPPSTPPRPPPHHARSHLQQHRPMLAPPDTAPIRPVPGPRWELDRSPFLSDEDPIDDMPDDEDLERLER